MATVKDLLRAETLRLGSVAPVAGGNAVDLIGVAKAGTVKYVLPETGYVGLCARTPLNVWTGLECNGLAAQSRSNAGESFSTLYIYGRKGDSVNITVESTDAVGWLRFVKAIGGVNCPTLSAIFEKGGGLCLRLKTASETSVKQAADWLSHLHIAPADGYVTVWAEGSASVTVELRIDYSLQQLSSNAAASWGKATIPCTRGQKLYYAFWGGGFKRGEAYFVPSLGSQ